MRMGKQKGEGKKSTKNAVAKRPRVESKAQQPTKLAAETAETLAASLEIESQATRLADQKIPAVQRQALAAHIGRLSGNQYLQRVMFRTSRLKTKGSTEIRVSAVSGQNQGEIAQRDDSADDKKEAAEKIHKAIEGIFTDKRTIFSVLIKHSGEGKAINAEYKRLSGGVSLKKALNDSLSGEDLHFAWKKYHGRLREKHEAKLLNIAMKGAGTDDALFWKTLTPYEEKSTAERRALMDAYDKYGNLMEHIDADYDFGDFEKAAMMLALEPKLQLDEEGQEEEAKKTKDLCKEAVGFMRAKSGDEIYKNTAKLFRKKRVKCEPLTLRHDSFSLVAKGGDDPRTKAYYFTGLKEDNKRSQSPGCTGTIDGNTVLIRGTDPHKGMPTKKFFSRETIANTIIHETSHILVRPYGVFPKSRGDAGSFDRYKNEFRAYWIEPLGSFIYSAKLSTPLLRAEAIKEHLVGTGPKPGDGGYEALRLSYHGSADSPQSVKPNREFKRKVDAHIIPETYNLKNNPNLEHLFSLLEDYPSIFTKSRFEKTLKFIKEEMTAPERLAARSSSLIPKLIKENVGDVRERLKLRRALKEA